MRLETPALRGVDVGGGSFFSSLGQTIATSVTHVRDRIVARTTGLNFDREASTLVINGHPDPSPQRFCAALCDAYVEGARTANRSVRRLDAGKLTMTLAAAEMELGACVPPNELEPALEMIRWAGHLTIIFPLWLDQTPVPLQRLLSAASHSRADTLACRVAAARSRQRARTIVTMDMPAFAHRSMFRDRKHAPVLELPGISTDGPTFIGCVNTISDAQRKRWLGTMHELGMAAA